MKGPLYAILGIGLVYAGCARSQCLKDLIALGALSPSSAALRTRAVFKQIQLLEVSKKLESIDSPIPGERPTEGPERKARLLELRDEILRELDKIESELLPQGQLPDAAADLIKNYRLMAENPAPGFSDRSLEKSWLEKAPSQRARLVALHLERFLKSTEEDIRFHQTIERLIENVRQDPSLLENRIFAEIFTRWEKHPSELPALRARRDLLEKHLTAAKAASSELDSLSRSPQ